LQDTYYELTLEITEYKNIINDFLVSATDVGFEEFENTYIVRSEDHLDDLAWAIKSFIKKLNITFSTNISYKINILKQKTDDWVKIYQSAVKPILVKPFYIRPTWYDSKNDYINILIDPALSFGTGHHETTSSCLEVIGRYAKKDMFVIDVGCGSGLLGIGAYKLGAMVDICDTDQVAIDDSIKNFKINTSRYNKAWVGSIVQSNKQYDIVVANIVADILIFIAKDLKNGLKNNSILILSGILEQYLDKVTPYFSELKLKEVIEKNEWRTLVYIKE
jgi:ribosomal protein L11 methyltransferase